MKLPISVTNDAIIFYCMCVIRLSCRAKLPMCPWVKLLYKSTVLKVLYKSMVLEVLCKSTWLNGPYVCAFHISLSLCVCLIFCVMPGYWFQAEIYDGCNLILI